MLWSYNKNNDNYNENYFLLLKLFKYPYTSLNND